MNLKKILTLTLACSIFTLSVQAEEIGGVNVTGEAAFDYNLVTLKNQSIPGGGGAKDNQYRFNYAQLILKKETEKLNFFGRLFYLPTEYESNGKQSTSNLGVLNQLEIFYKVDSKLQVGFGRFLTSLGYESPFRTVNHTYNYTISRQTLYPGYAEGLRAKYHFTPEILAIVSSYNRFADSTFGDDNSTSKATEAAITGTSGKLRWYAGYITSRDNNLTEKVDNKGASIWGAYKFSDPFSFIATYENRSADTKASAMKYTQSFTGTLVYVLGINNLALRYEHVRGANDINAINAAADFKTADKVESITLTDKIAIHENLNLYVEYRTDKADEKAFVKGNGGIVRNASMLTLGAIAHF